MVSDCDDMMMHARVRCVTLESWNSTKCTMPAYRVQTVRVGKQIVVEWNSPTFWETRL